MNERYEIRNDGSSCNPDHYQFVIVDTLRCDRDKQSYVCKTDNEEDAKHVCKALNYYATMRPIIMTYEAAYEKYLEARKNDNET